MIDILISNIKIVFTIVISFIIINSVIRYLLRDIIKKWNNSWIGSQKAINAALQGIFIYGFLVYLVTLQQNYNFIEFGKEESYISLVVNILTLYGIFYAFIQFAINYASQNERDKYWGQSKTQIMLSDNIEYRIFLSKTFKLFLLFSSVFPIIKLKKQILFNFLSVNTEVLAYYKNLIVATWHVSLFCIYILYILLFLKSLLILLGFFAIQEKNDFSAIRKIKYAVINYFQDLFLDSYKEKDDLFFKEITKKINSAEVKEKTELANLLLTHSFAKLIKIQQKKEMEILKRKKISKSVLDEYKYSCYYLINLFEDLWEYVGKEDLGLGFKELLSFYRTQNIVLFNQINIFCLGKKVKVVKQLTEIFKDKKFQLEEIKSNTFFEVPEILWNKVTTYRELIELNDYIIERNGTKELIKKIDNELITKRISKCCGKLIDGYRKYISILVDKGREFEEELSNDKQLRLFASTWRNDNNTRIISPGIQLQIFNYIYNLVNNSECNESNKKYIRILLNKLLNFRRKQLIALP